MDLCAKASHCKALLAIYKGYLTLPQKILYCPPSSSDMKDCCRKKFFQETQKIHIVCVVVVYEKGAILFPSRNEESYYPWEEKQRNQQACQQNFLDIFATFLQSNSFTTICFSVVVIREKNHATITMSDVMP